MGNITIITTNATNTVAIINIYTTINSGSPNGTVNITQRVNSDGTSKNSKGKSPSRFGGSGGTWWSEGAG